MNAEQQHYFAERLKQEKIRLMNELKRLESRSLEMSFADATSELSRYDNHPADLGSETFERGKDIALRDNLRLLLENVEKAIESMQRGDYGVCSNCGKQIPIDRLEAIPWANECVDCQTIDDGRDYHFRPIEEEVLSPPFARTYLDRDAHRTIAFDGEDAFQAVQRYGTADSPQDLPGMDDYDTLTVEDDAIGIVDPADAIPDDTRRLTRADIQR